MDAKSRGAMKPLITFFFLTFAGTWTFWLAASLVGSPSGSSELLLLPGTIMPAVVALWLTRRADGTAGIRALLERLFAWHVNARWYVFAIGYLAAIKLATALVHRLAMGAWPRFGEEGPIVIIVAIMLSTPVQAGEETGWRGYALPRMVEWFGLGWSSILLGVIWAAWHLPLFLLPGPDKAGQSFPIYLLGVTALSVAIAWLYAQTKGSVLLSMLMHAAINNTTSIVPGAIADAPGVFSLKASPVGWLSLLLMWICAGYFLLRMPKLDVHFVPRRQNS